METQDVACLVKAKVRELVRRAVAFGLVAVAGLLAGGATGFFASAARVVETQVVKEVPTFVDRKVEVVKWIEIPPFASVCPKCGNRHWAYPPNATGSLEIKPRTGAVPE